MQSDQKKCPRCAELIKAEAVVCRHCQHEFGPAPLSIDKSEKKARKFVVGCLALPVCLLAMVTCMSQLTTPGTKLAATSSGVDGRMQAIKDKVADDAVKQFSITQESGTAMDRCTQAGMVAAAFLQAQKSAEYANWKRVQKENCAAAGLGRFYK